MAGARAHEWGDSCLPRLLHVPEPNAAALANAEERGGLGSDLSLHALEFEWVFLQKFDIN